MKGGETMSEAVSTATSTEMQNNFGRYLHLVMNGGEVVVTRNGKEVGRFIPRYAVVSYLTDSLTGILSNDVSLEQAKDERMRARYSPSDLTIQGYYPVLFFSSTRYRRFGQRIPDRFFITGICSSPS